MTANGWFQIAVFLALILLVTKPLGVFMTRVFNRERTFLDPVLRPVERLLYRVDRRGREPRDALDGVCRLHAAVQRGFHAAAVPDRAGAGHLPFNPQNFAAVPQALAFNTAASFTTNTNWQNYSRRDHHELSDPDGWARLSQLHFGGGWHCAGDRVHSRHCAASDADHRQLLGGHGAQLPVGAAAVLHHRSAGAGVAGRGAEPEAVRYRETGRAACRCRTSTPTASPRWMPAASR